MPDNDNNDLRNRLAVIEQQFGLSTTNDNPIQAMPLNDNQVEVDSSTSIKTISDFQLAV